MTGLPAPWATPPTSRTLGANSGPMMRSAPLVKRLLRRRRGAIRRRMVVLDEQCQIVAAGLGQSEFGGIAHATPTTLAPPEACVNGSTRPTLTLAGADLIGRRGGRRRVGFLRLRSGRPADVRTGRRRIRSPPAPAASGNMASALVRPGANGARQNCRHAGDPQACLPQKMPLCATLERFPSKSFKAAALYRRAGPQARILLP